MTLFKKEKSYQVRYLTTRNMKTVVVEISYQSSFRILHFVVNKIIEIKKIVPPIISIDNSN